MMPEWLFRSSQLTSACAKEVNGTYPFFFIFFYSVSNFVFNVICSHYNHDTFENLGNKGWRQNTVSSADCQHFNAFHG